MAKAKKPTPKKKLAAKRKPARPARKTGPKAAAKKRADAAAEAASEVADDSVFAVEVEPGSVEETLKRVRGELKHWVNKGRYTKVRFRIRGKQILPDLPVAAVIAAEAVTFWWAGLLRALLVTVGAGAFLDVELVNDADRQVAKGKDALLAGDLDRALECFQKAVEMNRDCAPGYLNLGIAHKLKGERDLAREALEKARDLSPEGTVGEEAKKLLDQMKPPAPPAPPPA